MTFCNNFALDKVYLFAHPGNVNFQNSKKNKDGSVNMGYNYFSYKHNWLIRQYCFNGNLPEEKSTNSVQCVDDYFGLFRYLLFDIRFNCAI